MAKAPTPSLVPRIQQSLDQGRSTQALDLAKQHALQNPSPASQELLRRCYLTAAEFHVHRDAFRDAHSVLSEAEKMPFEGPEWWTRLAELRADLGDHGQAMKLLEKVNDPTGKNKILGRLADRAMREPGDTGKRYLPPEHHVAFALVQQAFVAYDKKHDDQARELLNGVGLASPFLEWKLMLRGLMAWSANEDDKARENWNRLNPTRLPAKLVAPLRFGTDKAFATTLPPAQQQLVSQQAEGLGNNISDALRRLRKFLSTDETLPQALELARTLVPEVKKLRPELVPRLSNVFYWGIVSGGQPDDMARFNRVFGPHPDDPSFFRLQALVMEGMNDTFAAHKFWGMYEEWIAKTPERWPGAQGAYARSLLLERMGDLANEFEEQGDAPEDFLDFMSFVDPRGRKPDRKPPKPGAAECFQKASNLAPQRYQTTLKLLAEMMAADKKTEVAPIVAKLLADFPKSLPILDAASAIYDELGDLEKAQTCVRQALAINPLDRKLQTRVAQIALSHARRFGLGKDYDTAKNALQEAKVHGDGNLLPAILALQFALEMKAGNAVGANPLYEELTKLPQHRVAGPYRVMVEMSRLKCVKKTINPYTDGFNDGLKTLTIDDLTGLLAALELYRQEPAPYYGMKSHEKKILDSIGKIAQTLRTIHEIIEFGLMLHRQKMWKNLVTLAETGLTQDRNNLYCQFFLAEALYLKQRNPRMNYRTMTLYRTVMQRLEQTNDAAAAKVRELFEQRKRESPEIEELLTPRFDWGW